jgi:hypothetical protein
VKNRMEEWWECVNRACGCEILFLMLGQVQGQTNPTCFCGSIMKRSDVRPQPEKHEFNLAIRATALETALAPAVSAKFFVTTPRKNGLRVFEN